jgi:hypothetical protein
VPASTPVPSQQLALAATQVADELPWSQGDGYILQLEASQLEMAEEIRHLRARLTTAQRDSTISAASYCVEIVAAQREAAVAHHEASAVDGLRTQLAAAQPEAAAAPGLRAELAHIRAELALQQAEQATQQAEAGRTQLDAPARRDTVSKRVAFEEDLAIARDAERAALHSMASAQTAEQHAREAESSALQRAADERSRSDRLQASVAQLQKRLVRVKGMLTTNCATGWRVVEAALGRDETLRILGEEQPPLDCGIYDDDHLHYGNVKRRRQTMPANNQD